MIEAVKRLLLLGLIMVGAWIWGHWVSLLVGILIGVVLWRLWARPKPGLGGGLGAPRSEKYQRVEGYGWMRVR